ncbi:MAG: tRNA lysidine(34) synthetase TilS [Paracoccaceae bacterium]|nr:tRNA lysidine(34) synthetase TilS [Paracoccaceae bacterium]
MPAGDPAERLLRLIDEALTPDRPARLGVAVSGGGDSMALLHLLHRWAAERAVALFVVTVDHGLRPASAAEAAMVGEVCEALGLPHQTLKWGGWDGIGNLQDRARRARYGLMADWALALGLGGVALAHTADDQAETFVMRLGRGAGIDGLSAMGARRRAYGIDWLRPLLQAGRGELRAFLTLRRLGWVEDPSNADPRFERVRVREVLAALEPLGIGAEALAATASRLAEAREALDATTISVARRIARVEAGEVVLDPAGLLAETTEIRRRLLSHALSWVASADYRPRRDTMAEALQAVAEGRDMTLHGCRLLHRTEGLRVGREAQALQGVTSRVDALWDRRWRMVPPQGADLGGLRVEALGEKGISLCPDWRGTGLRRTTLSTMPAVWRGDDLVAAPHAGRGCGWQAELARGEDDYVSSILSH